MKNQCLEAEMEYREWRESPLWYCVKTVLHLDTGKVESEIVTDEKTKIPLVIQDFEKPQDGGFETATEIIQYSYHAGYKAAEQQVNAVKMALKV